jgi:hypothetical protein
MIRAFEIKVCSDGTKPLFPWGKGLVRVHITVVNGQVKRVLPHDSEFNPVSMTSAARNRVYKLALLKAR